MNLAQKFISGFKSYHTNAKQAQLLTGKPLITQLKEIRQLRTYAGQCGMSDYYQFCLYDDHYIGTGSRKDYIGWRIANDFSKALNPRHVVLPAWDKCVFTQLADAAGLPTIQTKACFHSNNSISTIFGEHLKNESDAKKFLMNNDNYPLFGKPAYSQQGIGACYLKSYNELTQQINFIGKPDENIDTFIKQLLIPISTQYHKPECGFLFQVPLQMPPELIAFTQWPALSSLRVICLNSTAGSFPIRAIWKVSIPPNNLDNFSKGAHGNLMANVDIQSGEISRLVDNMWPKANVHEYHPFSKKAVKGFVLPQWSQVLKICQQAGKTFPLMKIHHWDIALTNNGPKILELNDLGGIEIAQIHGQGLLANGAREFLKKFGNSHSYPWINQL